jgi:hypothetical protein
VKQIGTHHSKFLEILWSGICEDILGLCWNIADLRPERRKKWSLFDLILSLDLYQVSRNSMWKESVCFVCQHLRYRHTSQRELLLLTEKRIFNMNEKKYEFLHCSNRQDIVENRHEANTALHIYLIFHIRYFTISTNRIYVFYKNICDLNSTLLFAMIGLFPVQ